MNRRVGIVQRRGVERSGQEKDNKRTLRELGKR